MTGLEICPWTSRHSPAWRAKTPVKLTLEPAEASVVDRYDTPNHATVFSAATRTVT
jgi:hypothetical protein